MRSATRLLIQRFPAKLGRYLDDQGRAARHRKVEIAWPQGEHPPPRIGDPGYREGVARNEDEDEDVDVVEL